MFCLYQEQCKFDFLCADNQWLESPFADCPYGFVSKNCESDDLDLQQEGKEKEDENLEDLVRAARNVYSVGNYRWSGGGSKRTFP